MIENYRLSSPGKCLNKHVIERLRPNRNPMDENLRAHHRVVMFYPVTSASRICFTSRADLYRTMNAWEVASLNWSTVAS